MSGKNRNNPSGVITQNQSKKSISALRIMRAAFPGRVWFCGCSHLIVVSIAPYPMILCSHDARRGGSWWKFTVCSSETSYEFSANTLDEILKTYLDSTQYIRMSELPTLTITRETIKKMKREDVAGYIEKIWGELYNG